MSRRRNLYPSNILPSPKFKHIIDLNSISSSVLLVRRSNKTYDETFNHAGTLRADFISPYKEIFGMSMNILGNTFQIDHLKFNPKRRASKEWDGNESVKTAKVITDVEIIKDKSLLVPIFFDRSLIDNIDIPYYKTKGQMSDLQKRVAIAFDEDFRQLSNSTIFPFTAQTKVEHVPTRANYWHAEFRIYSDQGEKISGDSAYKKNIVDYAYKNAILANGMPHIQNIKVYKIDKSDFKLQ